MRCKMGIFSYVFVFAVLSCNVAKAEYQVVRHLSLSQDLKVSWFLNQDTSEITYNITAKIPVDYYVSIGISINGAMRGADMLVGWVSPIGDIVIEDRYGIGTVEPLTDGSQDWKLLAGMRNASHTFLSVSRLLNTGDENEDVEITDDTLRLIWAIGRVDREQGRLQYHGALERGIVSVNFLDPAVETPSHEELLMKYQLFKTQKRVKVSSNDTVYMCSFFKGPSLKRKNHMIGFGMHIDPVEKKRHLHHADLYRCAAPPGVDPDEFFAPYLQDEYDCNYSPIPFPYENCGLFEFQWTIGGGITLFPDDLGLPIGRDDGRVEYFMTEVHFDNPRKQSDLEITAGFNIYYTPEPRPMEIGQLQVGFMTNKTYALTVPPNSTDFVVSSHCPMDCTQNMPADGINVFTYLLHSHLSGRRLKLRHFRDNVELTPLAKDDYFDFNYQNNRRLRNPIKILPNDHLTIECTYDSKWKRGGSTLGGRSAREEMCQGFLLYYPRNEDVVSCGSYHDQKEILGFMGVQEVVQYQGEIDATIVAPSHLAGLKYSHVVENLIDWNNETRVRYQELVRSGQQHAYCIPIEYDNEPFVMTNYPTVEGKEHTTWWFIKGYRGQLETLVFIGFGAVIGIACFVAGVYLIMRMRRVKRNTMSTGVGGSSDFIVTNYGVDNKAELK